MLTSLRIQGFKSWADTGKMRFAPITAFFGPNSSGKSSILQFLLMLKQTVESNQPNQVLNLGGEPNSLVNLGTLTDILHEHRASRLLHWGMGWDSNDPDPDFRHGPRRFTAKVDSVPFVKSDQSAVSVPQLLSSRFEFPDETTGQWKFLGLEREQAGSYALRGTDYPPIAEQDSKFSRRLGSPGSFHRFPNRAYNVGSFERLRFQTLEIDLANFLRGSSYLGPLRAAGSRTYEWHGEVPHAVGSSGEKTVQAILAAERRQLLAEPHEGGREQDLERSVSDRFEQMGLLSQLRVHRLSEDGEIVDVLVTSNGSHTEVRLPDVGFGISQVLPVITLLHSAQEGSTVILEQPEIHLHPAAQAGLADVIMDAVKTRKIQVILESHSEHLLMRLQRRIAEEEFKAEDAALYFCQMEGGASKLTTLDLNEYGDITNWPDGFFGDALDEAYQMSKAQLKRRREAQKADAPK